MTLDAAHIHVTNAPALTLKTGWTETEELLGDA